MSPAACISQTISSDLASAALWLKAGDPKLAALPFFKEQECCGFGGRQAFSKGNDVFYGALAGVTTVSTSIAREYDTNRPYGILPTTAICVLPLVVVEGDLFEAYYNNDEGAVRVEPAKYIRCHWTGAPSWNYRVTLDIVSLNYLDEYIAERREDISTLLGVISQGVKEISHCFDSKSIKDLNITKGSRGTIGIHPLIQEAYMRKPSSNDA